MAFNGVRVGVAAAALHSSEWNSKLRPTRFSETIECVIYLFQFNFTNKKQLHHCHAVGKVLPHHQVTFIYQVSINQLRNIRQSTTDMANCSMMPNSIQN